ncbi:hypothetical protein KCU90_g89, partial [Aureobasidium melanogenum]
LLVLRQPRFLGEVAAVNDDVDRLAWATGEIFSMSIGDDEQAYFGIWIHAEICWLLLGSSKSPDIPSRIPL